LMASDTEWVAFVDSIRDPRFHDANRVIVEGRWDPEALAYAGYVMLERWGYEGLKASSATC